MAHDGHPDDPRPGAAVDLERLAELLDAVPSEPPSPALAARVLRASPARRRARSWAIVVAVPLAAAAAVVLWLAVDQHPPPAPPAAAAVPVGEYTSPTDVLLGSYGVDVYATVPAIGCGDSALGCPRTDAVEPYSSRGTARRSLA